VGKNRVQVLKNNDEISISKKENAAFIFIDLSNREEKNWPSLINQKYTITKTLGVGAFGEVKLAFDKTTCEKYALKILPKRMFTVKGRHMINQQSTIMSEVEILKRLNHPCIIQIKEGIDTPDNVFIVLELVEGGELFDKVISLGQYSECTAKLIFYQMVLAIKYLHDQGISHRDLKPENILLCSAENDETLIKVTDFGLSKFFDNTQLMKTFCGTPNYLAPEVS
jgi:serine/threonine-protein kinase Chk2